MLQPEREGMTPLRVQSARAKQDQTPTRSPWHFTISSQECGGGTRLLQQQRLSTSQFRWLMAQGQGGTKAVLDCQESPLCPTELFLWGSPFNLHPSLYTCLIGHWSCWIRSQPDDFSVWRDHVPRKARAWGSVGRTVSCPFGEDTFQLLALEASWRAWCLGGP